MSLNVLIVDDNISICQNLADILEDHGHTVAWCSNSEEAITNFGKNKRFDVAFLDWKMPKLSGVKLLERLRRIDPDLLAVLVTGYQPDREELKQFDAHFQLILEKPIDVGTIIRFLNDQTPTLRN